MAERTGIEWCDATFNPWWGCMKVSPGCANCYAENSAHRWGHEVWGPAGERRFFPDRHWAEPMAWWRRAVRDGVRRRVFCGSMCDIFEDLRVLDSQRTRLWELIEATPDLDWLLLTKRPENIARMCPIAGVAENIWLGTSAEDQERYDERLEELLCAPPASVKFISAEPLLGPIDLCLLGTVPAAWGMGYKGIYQLLDWVIVGGESQDGCRPMELSWAREVVKQCRQANVACFVKQLGGHPDKRDEPQAWPEDLRVREFPVVGLGQPMNG